MLVIEDISFSYSQKKPLFSGLSLTLPEKGLIHLRGKNGSGKTTFTKIIAKLITPKNGSLKWKNSSLNSDDITFLSSQNESSYPFLTGAETIDLFARLNENSHYKKSDWWSILRKSPQFEEALEKRYSDCSTGMRQLINLSRTLTKESPIILLDEPFLGLDSENKKIFEGVIELQNERLVILTSHRKPDLTDHSSLVLSQGSIYNA